MQRRLAIAVKVAPRTSGGSGPVKRENMMLRVGSDASTVLEFWVLIGSFMDKISSLDLEDFALTDDMSPRSERR